MVPESCGVSRIPIEDNTSKNSRRLSRVLVPEVLKTIKIVIQPAMPKEQFNSTAVSSGFVMTPLYWLPFHSYSEIAREDSFIRPI